MTQAVCVSCGARKHGAFVPCRRCGWAPSSREEHAKSMLLSDRMLDAESLEAVSKALESGESLDFPEDTLREMASSMPTDQDRGALFEQWNEQSERFARRMRWFFFGLVVILVALLWRLAT